MGKPLPEPRPGLYLDSSGTLYRAAWAPKTGWQLQRQAYRSGYLYDNHPFPYAAFSAAVRDHLFTPIPTP